MRERWPLDHPLLRRGWTASRPWIQFRSAGYLQLPARTAEILSSGEEAAWGATTRAVAPTAAGRSGLLWTASAWIHRLYRQGRISIKALIEASPVAPYRPVVMAGCMRIVTPQADRKPYPARLFETFTAVAAAQLPRAETPCVSMGPGGRGDPDRAAPHTWRLVEVGSDGKRRVLAIQAGWCCVCWTGDSSPRQPGGAQIQRQEQ